MGSSGIILGSKRVSVRVTEEDREGKVSEWKKKFHYPKGIRV
jgi:predicted GTPase